MRRTAFAPVLAIAAALCLSTSSALAQPDPASNLILSAIRLPNGVRYSMSYLKPAEVEIGTVSVNVILPPDAQLLQVFDTEAIPFSGATLIEAGEIADEMALQPSLNLYWNGEVAEGAEMPTLAFTLAEEVSDEISASVQVNPPRDASVEATPDATALPGTGDIAGGNIVRIAAKPQPLEASTSVGTLALSADGTGGALLPVGTTGVYVGAAANPLLADAEVTVTEMPREENPPPDLDPNIEVLWWCSLVRVEGLPEEAALSVVVPLRRPLAPFTPVSLFQQQDDGTWAELAEQGIVSADGLTVAYIHTGGAIATGIDMAVEPRLIEGDDLEIETLDLRTVATISASGDDLEQNDTDPVFPACEMAADVNTPSQVCTLFEGVYRQCLPGYINCTFTSPDFGTCFDAGILGTEDGVGPLCTIETEITDISP